MYKIGSTNTEMNKLIQEAVGAPIDGIFGPLTQRYVINWQSANNLVADGIVGPKTLDAMGILDTDIKEHHVVDTEFDLTIEKYYLSKGQYIEQEYPILNDYLFLHHTAGWNNPYRTIDHWNRDSRGRVATEFVLDSYADNAGAHTANGGLSFDNSLNARHDFGLGSGIGRSDCYGQGKIVLRYVLAAPVMVYKPLDTCGREYLWYKGNTNIP